MKSFVSRKLADVAPDLQQALMTGDISEAPRYEVHAVRRETIRVVMRDGIDLATDLYLPPLMRAPAIAARTPYGRASPKLSRTLLSLAQRGYVAIAQDVRGTGDSEPDFWDYYMHEQEDGLDFVDWVVRQPWFDGFLGSCGGSYLGATQWCMGMHPQMSAIAPEVCGLGFLPRTTRCHMFLTAYARSVGRGADKVPIPYEQLEGQILGETLAGGFFNEPLVPPTPRVLLKSLPHLQSMPVLQGKRWLWEYYCGLDPHGRKGLIRQISGKQSVAITDVEVLTDVFGQNVPHDAHLMPRLREEDVIEALRAPPLITTGWYDWFIDDALATWDRIQHFACENVRQRSRLLITPSAHLMPGYREGRETHPELDRVYRTQNLTGILNLWYTGIRAGNLDAWPKVVYYLMGANEWRAAASWPPPETRTLALYLVSGGQLSQGPPTELSPPTCYTYDPIDPTPTVGGSIISYVYPTGSVDVSAVQRRPDVVTFTTEVLERDVDVVGPLRLILYFSSSAVDTDVTARVSDVFPDGRAIQLQSGILRLRYRNGAGDPRLLEAGKTYCVEVDLWATANRFRAGHRLRLDIASSDFPRFDRHSNRAGDAVAPTPADQRIYHDPQCPSHLLLSILD